MSSDNIDNEVKLITAMTIRLVLNDLSYLAKLYVNMMSNADRQPPSVLQGKFDQLIRFMIKTMREREEMLK